MLVTRPRIVSQLDVPGHDPETTAGGRVRRGPVVERIPVLVAPLADGDRVGQRADELLAAGEDVAPHEHFVSLELGERAQGVDPGEVVVDAGCFELPRLVEADVHAPAREVGEQLVEQPAHEVERAGIRRLDGGRPAEAADVIGEALGSHRERAVAVVRQPALHVAQAVLVRDQLDVALAAERVERPDLVGA